MGERRSGKISALILSSTVALLALPCGSAAVQASTEPLQADAEKAQFGARVDLMLLPVSVLDGDGLPAQGLSSEDFIVTEDGVERDVAVLLSPNDAPLDIALLIDVNDSMENFHYMEGRVKSSVADFLDQLSDDDCVFFLRYRETLRRGLWGRPRDPALRAAINEPPMEGGTALRDAIAEGLRRLEFDLERCGPASFPTVGDRGVLRRRRAMVVVADGTDRHSSLAFADLLSLAQQSEAPVLSVGLDDISLPQPYIRKALSDAAFAIWLSGRNIVAAETVTMLQVLATATGGHFIRGGESLGRLSSAYTEALRWLRSYYLVGYYLDKPDAAQDNSELPMWHDIEVRLDRPGYRVEARAGYFHTPVNEIAASQHVEVGNDLIAGGDIEGALIQLDMALQADPYAWEAHYRRGRALLGEGKTEEALQSLLAAAKLSPGQGEVHDLACGVALELGDYATAWEQAIRAHQAEVNVTEELLLLREEAMEPADLEERLSAPRIYVDSFGAIDPLELAAIRRVTRTLAQELSEVSEVGLIDIGALADYRIVLTMKELSEWSPRQLEVDLEVWEMRPTGGERVYRRSVAIFDIEDHDGIAADLAPHITEILKRLSERRRN